MQDPSHRVDPPLQNHVHLISGHRYPVVPQLSIEQAFRYLIDAPQVVGKRAPVSWTYVSAPQDGMMWLEWLSPSRDNRFPSDGYVWCDPEQAFRQDFGTYTMEMMVHTVGYRPGIDPVASHARTRYHFIAKNPGVNAPAPDFALWIVHYHPADPQRHIPVNQVPPNQQQGQIINERKWLESQGRIDKKDFMLHDQDHWPSISVPTGGHMQRQMQQAGMYAAQRQPGRPPQPGGYPQPPPAKRQRQQGPPVVPGAPDVVPDLTLEDEENTSLGDFFDHLTPRDISVARYVQHHTWMEEVFSSPYASHQIVPADLGLGLMGELKGLTEGILDPPSLDFLEANAVKLVKPVEAQPFTNLKQEQVDEFNKRVEEHLKEGRAEIERMKAEHAAKMQEWKKTKALMQVEKRLRFASWEVQDDAVAAFRLEDIQGKGDDSVPEEHVEGIVKEVETLLGVKISSHEDAAMIEKGGLEDEPEHLQQPARRESQPQQQNALHGAQNQAGGQALSASNASRASSNAAQDNVQSNAAQQQTPGRDNQDSAGDDMGDMGLGDDTLLADMDLDMGEPEMQFDMSHVDTSGADATPQTTGDAQSTTDQQIRSTTATTASAQAAQTQAPAQQQTTTTAAASQQRSSNAGDSGNDDNMFQDTAFDDLTNMDDDGDNDGLIDFDGGMDMGDSAFGDAMHGMDSQDDGGSGGQQGNAGGAS